MRKEKSGSSVAANVLKPSLTCKRRQRSKNSINGSGVSNLHLAEWVELWPLPDETGVITRVGALISVFSFDFYTQAAKRFA